MDSDTKEFGHGHMLRQESQAPEARAPLAADHQVIVDGDARRLGGGHPVSRRDELLPWNRAKLTTLARAARKLGGGMSNRSVSQGLSCDASFCIPTVPIAQVDNSRVPLER